MKEDSLYIRHILDAIKKIEKYLKDLDLESFSTKDIVIDAVIRELEIIGEAARNLIKTNKMVSIRNSII